jgi:hypothetical protein
LCACMWLQWLCRGASLHSVHCPLRSHSRSVEMWWRASQQSVVPSTEVKINRSVIISRRSPWTDLTEFRPAGRASSYTPSPSPYPYDNSCVWSANLVNFTERTYAIAQATRRRREQSEYVGAWWVCDSWPFFCWEFTYGFFSWCHKYSTSLPIVLFNYYWLKRQPFFR